MLNPTEILTLAFLDMWKAHIEEIKNRYEDKTWISIITDYALNELRDAIRKIVFPYFQKGNDESVSDSMMFALVCDLKKLFDPADFLFLKATFTDDDKDRVFFLEQAQMISPENLRLQAITTFMAVESEETPGEVISHLNFLVAHTSKKDVIEYARIVDFIRELSNETPDFRPAETAQFLNSSSLMQDAKFSLLHLIIEKVDAQTGLQVLMYLNIPGARNHWNYQMTIANVCYANNDFKNALSWYQKAMANRNFPEYLYKLELQYKLSVTLRETGTEGQAVLLLREILFSGDYHETYSDYYMQAIADLTAYYVRLKLPKEADTVLKKLDSEMMDYMETLTGEGFLVIMADKALLEADIEGALRYYKKAFRLNTNPSIGEKIRMLEGNI